MQPGCVNLVRERRRQPFLPEAKPSGSKRNPAAQAGAPLRYTPWRTTNSATPLCSVAHYKQRHSAMLRGALQTASLFPFANRGLPFPLPPTPSPLRADGSPAPTAHGEGDGNGVFGAAASPPPQKPLSSPLSPARQGKGERGARGVRGIKGIPGNKENLGTNPRTPTRARDGIRLCETL